MSPTRMSKVENATRTVLDFHSACNHHNLERLKDLVDEKCKLETASPAPNGRILLGQDSIITYFQDLFIQNPGVKLEIEDVFGMGFHVVLRWRNSGGGYAMRGVDIYKVVDGKIREILSYVKG